MDIDDEFNELEYIANRDKESNGLKVFEEDWEGKVIGSETFWKEVEKVEDGVVSAETFWNEMNTIGLIPKEEVSYVSHLPSVEEMLEEKRQRVMKVETVRINTWTEVESELICGGRNVWVNLGVLDEERVLGYLPSKVWYENGFNLLFYVNENMPDEVRPFKEETYVMWFFVNVGMTLEYDIDIRMFMDQIMTPEGMVYFCVFDKSNYKLIVKEEV